MRKLIILILCSLSFATFSQTIILGKYLKTVPHGKKWVLKETSSPIIEVSEGSSQSGNGCNAIIESNPRNIEAIVEGQMVTGKPYKIYFIHFKTLDKVHYTNDYTYKVSQIISFDCYDVETRQTTHPNSITFYQDQNVWVTNCIESIEFGEYNLLKSDIELLKSNDVPIEVDNLIPPLIVPPVSDTLSYKTDDNKVNTLIEQTASFPGGEDKMMGFIQRNLDYPNVAREKNIQGRVVISFDIEMDGSLSNIRVIRSVNLDLDNEALRIIKMFPKWTPAKKNGTPVKTTFAIPVNFSLGDQ